MSRESFTGTGGDGSHRTRRLAAAAWGSTDSPSSRRSDGGERRPILTPLTLLSASSRPRNPAPSFEIQRGRCAPSPRGRRARRDRAEAVGLKGKRLHATLRVWYSLTMFSPLLALGLLAGSSAQAQNRLPEFDVQNVRPSIKLAAHTADGRCGSGPVEQFHGATGVLTGGRPADVHAHRVDRRVCRTEEPDDGSPHRRVHHLALSGWARCAHGPLGHLGCARGSGRAR